MKHLLLTTIAAVVLVGCGESASELALCNAARYGNIEAVKQHIAAGTDVNAKDKRGNTPLDYAVSRKYPEISDLLRKHGGKTGEELSIHKAAEKGNIEAVKQHIAAGTDVSAKNGFGVTPLHNAASGGHKEIAELLIAEGTDVNAKFEGGGTPLHIATHLGHKEIAELLIAKGADVNAKDVDGSTPLNWADGEIADLLRKHGGKTKVELEAEGK
jgi:ankyrin repeat protein